LSIDAKEVFATILDEYEYTIDQPISVAEYVIGTLDIESYDVYDSQNRTCGPQQFINATALLSDHIHGRSSSALNSSSPLIRRAGRKHALTSSSGPSNSRKVRRVLSSDLNIHSEMLEPERTIDNTNTSSLGELPPSSPLFDNWLN
jgi:hypothetical protein